MESQMLEYYNITEIDVCECRSLQHLHGCVSYEKTLGTTPSLVFLAISQQLVSN